ncbi:MAG: 1-acyl-sn-glycerol-3-phosphate acyltransferase [Kiritimatiellae bacterium]|nr:1-acyl-sn-glycerol-3-phosphate acyltransferase [Kiritimatiellia bacterium]
MTFIKILCLNVLFYLLFVLSSIVVIPLLSLYVLFVHVFWSRRTALSHFRRAICVYGRVVLYLPFPLVKVRGKDFGDTDLSGPCIYIVNHRSMSDPFLVAYLHKLGCSLHVVQVAKRWVLRLPVLGPLARSAGYLDIVELDIEEFYSIGQAYFSENISIICFPEGTRSGSRDIGSFHGAIFRLALKARVPIVPVCISGNENIPPRGTLLLHPGIITIHKLPALQPDSYADMTPFQLKNRVRDIISSELLQMDALIPDR